jgi:hypothetical protein
VFCSGFLFLEIGHPDEGVFQLCSFALGLLQFVFEHFYGSVLFVDELFLLVEVVAVELELRFGGVVF